MLIDFFLYIKDSISMEYILSPTLSCKLVNRLSEMQENSYPPLIVTEVSAHPSTLALVLPFSVTYSISAAQIVHFAANI